MAMKIGSAPDSWGVWFPDDDKQTPWQRCLAEIKEAGYEGTELGPWGYMPKDYTTIKNELDKHNLSLIGQASVANFVDDKEVDEFLEMAQDISDLLKKFPEAKYLVLITDFYSDEKTGESNKPRYLSSEQRKKMYANIQRTADFIRTQGLTPLFHPHADTYVMTEAEIEELLACTDIDLCLDTGHHVYGGGEPISFYEKHHSRIPYIHVKQCDMDIKNRMDAEGWPWAEAVARGVMCEPERGSIDFSVLLELMKEKGYDDWVVVEQDMYPVESFDDPLPIATRTREFFKELGL